MKSVFVGYTINSKVYRLQCLDSNVIVEPKDVEFSEDKLYIDSKIVSNPIQTQEIDAK